MPAYGPENGLLSFCFIDPFSAALDFGLIRELGGRYRMDFLILLMLGRDVRTNFRRYLDDPDDTRIGSLIDDPNWREEWRSRGLGRRDLRPPTEPEMVWGCHSFRLSTTRCSRQWRLALRHFYPWGAPLPLGDLCLLDSSLLNGVLCSWPYVPGMSGSHGFGDRPQLGDSILHRLVEDVLLGRDDRPANQLTSRNSFTFLDDSYSVEEIQRSGLTLPADIPVQRGANFDGAEW
jgi:hypothetical protein